MKIVCEFEDAPPRMRGLMSDLKTVAGYIRRLRKRTGLIEFIIYSEGTGTNSVRYLAFSSNLQRYYDYNEHEFKSIEYLIKRYRAVPYSIF